MKNNISIASKHLSVTLIILTICQLFLINTVAAQPASKDDPRAKEIIAMMNRSTEQWNKGDLAAFVGAYEPSATMMMPGGTVGLDSIRSLYQHKYFNGNMPKQNLRYSDMVVTFLGKDYALLTGAFTLYGNNMKERSGRYSLVMKHTANGWKILHDHSS